MKMEHTMVFGFEPALRGMRNPKESWDRADTEFDHCEFDLRFPIELVAEAPESPVIGKDDMKLMLSLVKAGGSHRKFLRRIMIWVDITIPRAIWQELDTYKVSTVRMSCSTMFKLGSRDLTRDDFQNRDVHPIVLAELNAMGLALREKRHFVAEEEDGIKAYEGNFLLEHLKFRLPEGYLQKATYSMSYESALKEYMDREHHGMPCWSGSGGLCEWILGLPYMNEIVMAAKG